MKFYIKVDVPDVIIHANFGHYRFRNFGGSATVPECYGSHARLPFCHDPRVCQTDRRTDKQLSPD